jgi:hypothetical protein
VPIKGSTLLLAASLTANAALVAVVAVRAPSLLEFGPATGAEVPAPSPAAPASAGRDASPRTWTALDAADLSSLAARLRAAGFPPNIIRAIIRARLDELFTARRAELAAQMGQKSFWNYHFGNLDPKTMRAFVALHREQAKTLETVLGADAEQETPFWMANRQDMNGGLSPEKNKRVKAIQSDYNELRNDVYTAAKGTLLPEDYEKLAYLEKEQQADIAEAMSPEELLEYQIRSSPTAQQMRNSMQAFNPSEEEFRAIFKVQQAFDQQYGSTGVPLSPDQQRERQAHQPEVLAQIQNVLGPDRFAEYKRETDPGYIAVNNLVERLELPPAATSQVVAVQDDITRRADAIRQDKSLSDADRTGQLAALAEEATSRASAILGERGLVAYKQGSGGWIQNLKAPAN